MTEPYLTGITTDLRTTAIPGGWFGATPSVLAGEPAIHLEYLPRDGIDPELSAQYDAVIVNGPQVTAASLGGSPRVRHIARFGSGYDSVDVAACTERGVVVTNAPDAISEPVATAAISLILALALRLPERERMARDDQWDRRAAVIGRSLRTATVGLIGFGGIARELVRLIEPFGTRIVVHHPRRTDEQLRAENVEPLGLDALLKESDFVLPLVPSTEETRHMIGARELALMQPTASLVNVSRGAIVDEAALVAALDAGALAGAALDVFEQEPPDPANPLLLRDDVIATPHSLAWTDGMMSAVAASALDSVRSVAEGRPDGYVINPEALRHPRWQPRDRERA